MSNVLKELPFGYGLLQVDPVVAVCFDQGDYHGWLFQQHPDGHLVSYRKLEEWEKMQAEDQIDEVRLQRSIEKEEEERHAQDQHCAPPAPLLKQPGSLVAGSFSFCVINDRHVSLGFRPQRGTYQ